MSAFYGGAQIVGRGTTFSRDGKYVVTAGEKGLYVYSALTARRISDSHHHRMINIATLGGEASTQVIGLIMMDGIEGDADRDGDEREDTALGFLATEKSDRLRYPARMLRNHGHGLSCLFSMYIHHLSHQSYAVRCIVM